MKTLELNGTAIAETFAEAFPIVGTRLIVTADSLEWARCAGQEATGNATSVIACDTEAAIEQELPPEETPDGRPGVSLLIFAFSEKLLQKGVVNRVGQNILTCPTTSCFNGVEIEEDESTLNIGGQVRFFGDGFQSSKKLGTKRFWRIPVMDGEFLCEEKFGTIKGVAGGNLILCGKSRPATLKAAELAVKAMKQIAGVILPFPGGIVRSGSKVGSRYPTLKASTNEAYCPTLIPRTETALPEGANCVYEIVVDGFSYEVVQEAMRVGLHTAAASPDLTLITAGNYGGNLGPHHFHLSKLV